ncbi:hypothetical protein BU23DRAFT_633394 [Bimuria novae-zelandiae CBS 107.79]|uniref:VIT-domain-containing protein n=1 Tax=Bimuria novae-zelandiae CBS 107.79 TaxID=1447943 RepID=A0A6A5VF38_9PLEO|nr:hypothetical protein BU23DRAFT_633394 [Bimuria novae-zelandiae CBS 107.79]
MPQHVCGCYYFHHATKQRQYLPQVNLNAHTTILSTASRTVLKQKFVNASGVQRDQIRLSPFRWMKEKAEARRTYETAKQRGEKAALVEQLPDAADVFKTTVRNIPKESTVEVSITYIQELKHDAEVDGVRLTIPTSISPRYGSCPTKLHKQSHVNESEGISFTIDVNMADDVPVKKVLSPSHPIEVSLGSISTSTVDEEPTLSKASVKLALETAQLDKDFVLQVVAKDIGVPQAFFESHPTLPNQRALMTTLVPKFNLKSQKAEIIFIADRSGSMKGNIPTLIAALKLSLKSIPVGCLFNICSFGSSNSFLWPKSQPYTQDTLAQAIKHVSKFGADFGETETLNAVKACFISRYKVMPTEMILLTDGDIWSQQQLFDYVTEETKSGGTPVFPIGIGRSVSSALIEGIARAGRGFAQMVTDNEKLDSKIVRMLKAALTPHVNDYRLEVKYEDDSVDSHQNVDAAAGNTAKPISLYDANLQDEDPKADEPEDIVVGLPKLNRPRILQAPYNIPPLYPFNRTCVYLLFSSGTADVNPKSVIVKGTSSQGPLELEISVQVRAAPHEMIHQLAARKAIQELEEGRGWIMDAVTDGEKTGETTAIRKKDPAKAALLQQLEAVCLGVEFQVGGKYCSFVAVGANEAEIAKKRQRTINASVGSSSLDDDWKILGREEEPLYAEEQFKGTEGPSPISDPLVRYARQRNLNGPMGFSGPMGLVNLTVASPPGGGVRPRHGASSSKLSLSAFQDRKEGKKAKKESNLSTGQAIAESEELDEENSDMGFGLFDSGSETTSQPAALSNVYCKRVMSSAMKTRKNIRRLLLAGKTQSNAGQEETAEEDTVDEGLLLEVIIAHQSFEGSWSSITNSMLEKMGLNMDMVRAAIHDLGLSQQQAILARDADTVMYTAIVARYLEEKMTDEQEKWELIVDKARQWLEDNVNDALLVDVWNKASALCVPSE